MTAYQFLRWANHSRSGILLCPDGVRLAEYIPRNQYAERASRNLKFVASSRSSTPGEAAK